MIKLKIHISVWNHTGKEKSMNTKTYFYLNLILTNFTLVFTTYLREIVIQKVNILMKTKLLSIISFVEVIQGPISGGVFLGNFPIWYLSLLGKHSTEGNLVSHERRNRMLGHALHKKWSFPLRISPVNVTKSAVSCGFGHIYRRNPLRKISFCVQWFIISPWSRWDLMNNLEAKHSGTSVTDLLFYLLV